MKTFHLFTALCLFIAIAQFAPAAEPETTSLDCGGGVTMELVKIPAGTFIMGTPDKPKEPLGTYLNWAYTFGAGTVAGVILLIIATRFSPKQNVCRFQSP